MAVFFRQKFCFVFGEPFDIYKIFPERELTGLDVLPIALLALVWVIDNAVVPFI